MALWKVTPDWKKSCVEKVYWDKEGKTIIIETGWRWGEFFLETEDDNPPDIEEGVDIFCCGYELVDWSTDDGCWEDYEYLGFSEDEKEEMESWMEENGSWELEENGWTCGDAEMYITCTMTIEKVEN